MDDREDLKIKAELDEIAKNIDSIMNRVDTGDPGQPPAPEPESEAGSEN